MTPLASCIPSVHVSLLGCLGEIRGLLGWIRGGKRSAVWEDGREELSCLAQFGEKEARLLGKDEKGLGKVHQLPHVLTCSQCSHAFSANLPLSGYGVQTFSILQLQHPCLLLKTLQ
jgi:hypothetical protein